MSLITQSIYQTSFPRVHLLCYHLHFEMSLPIFTQNKTTGIWIGIALNLFMNLGSIENVNNEFSNLEYNINFHLPRSLISLSDVFSIFDWYLKGITHDIVLKFYFLVFVYNYLVTSLKVNMYLHLQVMMV